MKSFARLALTLATLASVLLIWGCSNGDHDRSAMHGGTILGGGNGPESGNSRDQDPSCQTAGGNGACPDTAHHGQGDMGGMHGEGGCTDEMHGSGGDGGMHGGGGGGGGEDPHGGHH